MGRMKITTAAQKENRGMTILELLVVVAIIGILSAIAAFNYLGALEKARQKRTAADIRSIAMAWETYAAEKGTYNPAGSFTFPATAVDHATLAATLVPTYTRSLPQFDGWGNLLEFGFEDQTYAVRSLGKDGTADDNYDDPDLSDVNTDIVYSGGVFVVYPSGVSN